MIQIWSPASGWTDFADEHVFEWGRPPSRTTFVKLQVRTDPMDQGPHQTSDSGRRRNCFSLFCFLFRFFYFLFLLFGKNGYFYIRKKGIIHKWRHVKRGRGSIFLWHKYKRVGAFECDRGGTGGQKKSKFAWRQLWTAPKADPPK